MSAGCDEEVGTYAMCIYMVALPSWRVSGDMDGENKRRGLFATVKSGLTLETVEGSGGGRSTNSIGKIRRIYSSLRYTENLRDT